MSQMMNGMSVALLWNNQLDKGFYIKGDGISVELPNIPLRTFAMVDDKIASSVNSNDTKRHIVSKVGQKIMDKKRLERNDEKIDVHTVISWLQCFMEELHKLSDKSFLLEIYKLSLALSY